MHSDLNSWNSPSRTEGLKELISNDYEAVSVSVDISGSCILKVLWSNTNSSLSSFVDYGDTFSLNNNDYNFCVSKKSKYFYIKIENPTNITKLKVVTNFLKNLLKSTSELSAVSATICYGKDPNNNDVPLRLDASGNLKTTGSGGSGGGDASASNQLTQIQKAETTNEKLIAVNLSLDYLKTESHIQTLNQEAINQELDSIDAELVSLNSKIVKCDTDNVIIDSSNPVQVVGLAKVYNTLNNAFMTVDADQNLRVNVQNQIDTNGLATEQTLLEFKTQETPLQHEKNYANVLTDSVTLGADSNPAFTYHPSLDGWYYRNTVPNGASNLYFYGKTAQTRQATYTKSQLMSSYVVCKILNLQDTLNLPFLVVYSAPTGNNDYAPWYHSKWIYKVPNTTNLDIGMEFILYQGSQPNMRIHPELRRVEAVLTQTFGEGNSNETLLYCTVNTDSGATINTTQVIYKYAGIETVSGLFHDIELGYDVEDKTRAITQQIQNLNSTVGSGVFVQLDGNVSGLKLKSTNNDGSADVTIKNSSLAVSGSVNISNASLPVTGTFWQTTQPVSISGTVPISTSSHLDCNIFGSHDGNTFHHILTSPQGKILTNSTLETNANGVLTSTVSGTINALDVNISNTQVNSLIKGIDSTSQLPVNIESNNNSLNSYITNTVTTKSQNSTSTQISLNEYCYCQGSATNKALNSGLSVNTNGFLYANAFLNITNFTNSSGNYNYPNIYIQSSPDGTNWLNESSTQVSANGAFKVQLYNINVFPYLRLYVSNDYITTPNSVTFNVSSWIVQK